MSKETLDQIIEEEKSVTYNGGSIEYSLMGDNFTLGSPILIVPGFTAGRLQLREFANSLHKLANREVILPDQPVLGKSKQPMVDQHAEALLAILEQEKLTQQPVDVIAHSFGALITARAAELAKERGIVSFKSEKGSHSVFIAPAGSNDRENLIYLGGRWLRFFQREVNPTPFFSGRTRELDPTGEKLKAGRQNAKLNKSKTLKEVLVLSEKEKIYKNLGESGLRPFILGYGKDVLYPHRVVKTVMEQNGEALAGYAVPIGSSNIAAGSFKEFKAKTGWRGKTAKRAWAHHYRDAGHSDLQFHPERTVRVILPILNGNALQNIKSADAKYQARAS